MNAKCISALFYLSAAYDGVLGLIFMIAPLWAFHTFCVPVPNHIGYVQFPAALLLIFAVMFYMVAKDPVKHIDSIIYGILLKLSYCGITSIYWMQGTLPSMWRPFTICDGVMLILYVWAFMSLQDHTNEIAQ